MANHKEVAKQAFRMVDETCPKVDAALYIAANAIKQQTELLREALFEAIGRTIDAEEKINELQLEIKRLEERLEYANSVTV